MLVVFNDGISEATNRDGEEFGDDRIIECIQRDVDERQGDDMTVLVITYKG